QLNDLNAGNLTLNVVDAHGCTAQAAASIEEPSMLVANVIITGVETCAGNDGSAEISVEGGVPGYSILWSNGATGNNLEAAAAGNYNVAVTDANGCSLQMQAVITYECETVVPPTQLMAQFCNTSEFTLDGTLACDAVEGADQYMWRVSTPTGTIIIDEFTADNQLSMALIPDVDYSTTYVVGIKARVAGVWGPFGDYCSVSTESMDLPVTGILDADCGATISSWGVFIHATAIPNVLNYEWHITGDNYDWTAFTATPELEIVEAMMLIPGESYMIEVRCALGAGVFTEWSTTCGFDIAIEMNVADSIENTGIFNVYPNPGNGEVITIVNEGFMSAHDAIQVSIVDGSGKQAEAFTIAANSGSTYRYEFHQRLASGFYVLVAQSGDKRIEKKLIVH
ncbi:MAG: T9SS type A sorting domain-containing protein, partial [Flavobacteriales bacterium]